MAPPLNSIMAAAIKSGAPMVLLSEIEHPSGLARFWTGVGTLAWDGKSWTGAGLFGAVSPIQYTSAIAIQEIQFTLSGVDPTLISELDEDVRNLTGTVWLACLDDAGNVVDDPLLIVDAQLDYQSQTLADDGTSNLSITARTGFYTLERAIDDRWSSEDQKTKFPNDSGLDMISSLQNQALIWKAS